MTCVLARLMACGLGLAALGACVPEIGGETAVEAEQTDPGIVAEDELVSADGSSPGESGGQERTELAAAGGTSGAEALLPVPGSAPQPQGLPGTEAPVPHIYVSLQSDGPGRQVSAVFAIDAARDATPSDDTAFRLTPEDGLCNPQSMTSYTFPEADSDRPVLTEADRALGLTAANLPDAMAVIVTERMLAAGLAAEPEETRAMNVCTRKLWRQIVSAGNLDTQGGG